MKCPICGEELRVFGTTCHHKEKHFIKEIERLKPFEKAFNKLPEMFDCYGNPIDKNEYLEVKP